MTKNSDLKIYTYIQTEKLFINENCSFVNGRAQLINGNGLFANGSPYLQTGKSSRLRIGAYLSSLPAFSGFIIKREYTENPMISKVFMQRKDANFVSKLAS